MDLDSETYEEDNFLNQTQEFLQLLEAENQSFSKSLQYNPKKFLEKKPQKKDERTRKFEKDVEEGKFTPNGKVPDFFILPSQKKKNSPKFLTKEEKIDAQLDKYVTSSVHSLISARAENASLRNYRNAFYPLTLSLRQNYLEVNNLNQQVKFNNQNQAVNKNEIVQKIRNLQNQIKEVEETNNHLEFEISLISNAHLNYSTEFAASNLQISRSQSKFSIQDFLESTPQKQFSPSPNDNLFNDHFNSTDRTKSFEFLPHKHH